MADKKKPKKKVAKGAIAKASVVVNIGGRRGGKSQPRKKSMIKGTPEEYRKSSGYILSQPPTTIIQQPPSVQYLPAPSTNPYLLGNTPQTQLLTYEAPYREQQKLITQKAEEPKYMSVEEPPTTNVNIQDISETAPIPKMREMPERMPIRRGGTVGKTVEEKSSVSREKLNTYNFPERIANKGTVARDSDIDAIVQMMYDANTKQNANISATDLNRVYGIAGSSVKSRLEKISGMKSVGRTKASKIPKLSEYNLV